MKKQSLPGRVLVAAEAAQKAHGSILEECRTIRDGKKPRKFSEREFCDLFALRMHAAGIVESADRLIAEYPEKAKIVPLGLRSLHAPIRGDVS